MLKNTLNKLQRKSLNPSKGAILLFILFVIIIASALRIWLYGDINLSIASNDTTSYVESSRAPLFSSELMTGRRLLTTNIIYKIFEPKEGYQIIANGSIGTTRRVFQPGFNNIVILQLIMSIVGWGFLVFTISEYIKNPFMKILSAVTILVFAFTPQIAEWDSVLMSESLTFSLFALQFAFLIRIVFLSQNDSEEIFSPFLTGWIIVYFAWTFMRDTNLYAIPASIGLMILLCFSPKFKKNRRIGILILVLMGIFFLGSYTARNSSRDTIEIDHVYQSDLLPFPLRVEILQKMGMPSPNSPEFQTWFEAKGVSTFIKFMLTHPGYVASKFGKDILYAFDENMQPYFKIPELGNLRNIIIQIGNAMHPKSATPVFISILILPVFLYSGIKNPTTNIRSWAWVGFWLFTCASLTIFISIMAGAAGLPRHALFSAMLYRLFMWIFLIVALDIGLNRTVKDSLQKNNQ